MKRLLFVFTMLFCTILANTQNQFEVYGNNREVWCGNHYTTVQRTQYYPSGLPWAEGIGATVQNRKYNGKEFIEMHGYDTYDYGARGYYPAIMRFTTVDPLAESYYSQSPCHFSGNNPIRFLDLNGMNYDEWDYDLDSRKMTWVSDKGGNERQYVNVIKDGKQQGEASVSGDEVFVYKLRDNVLVTNTDKRFNDKTYNSQSNYEYTPTEFKKRDIYLKEKSPITTELLTSEREGKAMPLTYSQEEALYGYTVMRLKMFMSVIDQAWDVMPTPFPSVRRASGLRSLSSFGHGSLSSNVSITGYTGAKALTGRNSWNLFLKANKGVYSGQGWQKRAAVDYFKSSFYVK